VTEISSRNSPIGLQPITDYTSLKEEFINYDLYFLNSLKIYNKRLCTSTILNGVRSLDNLYSLFIASSLDSISFLDDLSEKEDVIV
jgi:hypothetical protein